MDGKYLTHGGTVFAVIVMDSVYRIWMDSDGQCLQNMDGQCLLS